MGCAAYKLCSHSSSYSQTNQIMDCFGNIRSQFGPNHSSTPWEIYFFHVFVSTHRLRRGCMRYSFTSQSQIANEFAVAKWKNNLWSCVWKQNGKGPSRWKKPSRWSFQSLRELSSIRLPPSLKSRTMVLDVMYRHSEYWSLIGIEDVSANVVQACDALGI